MNMNWFVKSYTLVVFIRIFNLNDHKMSMHLGLVMVSGIIKVEKTDSHLLSHSKIYFSETKLKSGQKYLNFLFI